MRINFTGIKNVGYETRQYFHYVNNHESGDEFEEVEEEHFLNLELTDDKDGNDLSEFKKMIKTTDLNYYDHPVDPAMLNIAISRDVVSDYLGQTIDYQVYINEADKELLEFLKTKGLLFKLSSFAGWNTSSNTLGTTISNLTSYYYSKDERKKNISLINRYIDDFIYMAIVREKLIMFIEGEKINGVNRFNLGEHKTRYETIAKEMIKEEVKNFSLELNNYIKDLDVDFIWDRTFEILLHLETNL